MSKLDPEQIQAMLSEAADALGSDHDRELCERLSASLKATDPADWDLPKIGIVLAKAGKHDLSKAVIEGIESDWERADATRAVAVALLAVKEKKTAFALLGDAAKLATKAQAKGSEQDQQSASAVLADISELYATHKKYKDGEKVIKAITHPIRQQRALDRLKELRGDAPPEPENE